jgi:hypothetical protein
LHIFLSILAHITIHTCAYFHPYRHKFLSILRMLLSILAHITFHTCASVRAGSTIRPLGPNGVGCWSCTVCYSPFRRQTPTGPCRGPGSGRRSPKGSPSAVLPSFRIWFVTNDWLVSSRDSRGPFLDACRADFHPRHIKFTHTWTSASLEGPPARCRPHPEPVRSAATGEAYRIQISPASMSSQACSGIALCRQAEPHV